MTKIKANLIGDHIRGLLDSKGLNTKEAAELMGIGRSTLSKVVNNSRPITTPMCCRLEALFGVNAEELATMQMKQDIEAARKEIAKENIKPYKPE